MNMVPRDEAGADVRELGEVIKNDQERSKTIKVDQP